MCVADVGKPLISSTATVAHIKRLLSPLLPPPPPSSNATTTIAAMYIAGLNLTLAPTRTSPGVVEPIIYTSLLVILVSLMGYTNKSLASATAKGGEIKRMPTSLLGKIVTPIHGAAILLSPALYLGSLPFYGFRQPEWFERTALPDSWLAELGLGETGKAVVKLVSMGVTIWLSKIAQKTIEQLDKQFHFIGVSISLYLPSESAF
jgi:hypothetical protein